MASRSSSRSMARAASTQADVIGALIMRELHTRYGRDNIGYLWLIGEPLMLAVVIGAFHTGSGDHFSSDIRPMPFAVIGYVIYIIFRGIFTRAEGTLEANLPLLYHKMVTIFDMMVAKAVIELAGCFATLAILIGAMTALDFGDWPARPLWLLGSILLMTWLSFAMSLLVVGYTHTSPLLARLTHPFAYLMIPVSGAFYVIDWLPEPARTWMSWNPLALVFEMARYGQFRAADTDHISPGFVIAVCAALTWWGLIAIRRTRRVVHLS